MTATSPVNPYLKKNHFVDIKTDQDAIFHGSVFAEEFIQGSSIKIDWLVEAGSPLLKGQSCAILQAHEEDQDKVRDLIKALSYLSGIATLVCCYIESAHEIKVVGSEAKNSSFNEWELKIIQDMKGFIKPLLPLWLITSKEQLPSLLKQNPQSIALNKNLLNKENLVALLNEIPKDITKGIYGQLLPQDLEELSDLPIDVCWPELLQGHFPSIKMYLHAEG